MNLFNRLSSENYHQKFLSFNHHSKNKAFHEMMMNPARPDGFNSVEIQFTLSTNQPYWILLNSVQGGTEAYQRTSRTLFLKKLLYQIQARVNESSVGGIIRWGFVYNKYQNTEASEPLMEHIFSSTVNDSTQESGFETFSNHLSFINTQYTNKYMVLIDRKEIFGICSTAYTSIDTTIPVQINIPPLDFYENDRIQLEPLMTVYDASSMGSTASDIVNGSLWMFVWVSQPDDTTNNYPNTITFKLSTRLYYNSLESPIITMNILSVLRNPLIIEIRRHLESGNVNEAQKLIWKVNDEKESKRIEDTSKVYKVLNSTNIKDTFYSIDQRVSNGLYVVQEEITNELKVIDFQSKAINAYFLRDGGISYMNNQVVLVNTIHTGNEFFQRNNSSVIAVEIDYSVWVSFRLPSNQPPWKPSSFPFSKSAKLMISLIYDKQPVSKINKNDNSKTNEIPTVDEIFSNVDSKGVLVHSAFKNPEYSKRFVILYKSETLLDSLNLSKLEFLGRASTLIENKVKLFYHANHSSAFVDHILQQYDPNNINNPSFKSAFNTIAQGLSIDFSPSILSQEFISSGCIYLVVSTNLIHSSKQANYPYDLTDTWISTRTIYLD